MTHLIIDSESELENGIGIATDLALLKGKHKTIELTFPSKFMATLFMNNLLVHWYLERIPIQNGLEFRLNVPEDDKDIIDWGTHE
jgi:hypothetical protein